MYMTCSVCKKGFIRTHSLREYYEKKKVFEDAMSKMIDELTEEEFENMYNDLWESIFIFEALLLTPNNTPKTCNNCNVKICYYCNNTGKHVMRCLAI